MFSVKDIMTMFSLSERTVRRHLQLGVLKGTKVGGSWRFTDEDLKTYLDSEIIRKSIQKTSLFELYDFFNGYGNDDEVLVMKKIPNSHLGNLIRITSIVNKFDNPFFMHMSDSKTNKVLLFRGQQSDAISLLEKVK